MRKQVKKASEQFPFKVWHPENCSGQELVDPSRAKQKKGVLTRDLLDFLMLLCLSCFVPHRLRRWVMESLHSEQCTVESAQCRQTRLQQFSERNQLLD